MNEEVEDGTTVSEKSMEEKKPIAGGCTADEILTAEFGYISESAFQANEDRARVSTYYLVTFGTLVAALFSLQVESADLDNIHIALIIVFLTLALFGLSTLLQLVRLRQAWMECAVAMNQVKDFYVDELAPLDIASAMRWRRTTIPPMYKPWSIGFLMAAQVALLGGVSMGASAYFLGLVTGRWTWWPAVVAGLFYFGFQMWLYRRLLKD